MGEKTSFIVEAEGKKLRVSFEEKNLNWKDARNGAKKMAVAMRA